MAYLAALIHEITFLDKEKAIKYLSKFEDAVRLADEFYTDSGVDTKNGDALPESYFISFLEQMKKQV